MRPDQIKAIAEQRIAKDSTGHDLVLKRTIAHMRGKTLTEEQERVNAGLSGLNQLNLVHQLIQLLETDMLDTGNAALMDAVVRLRSLLSALGDGKEPKVA